MVFCFGFFGERERDRGGNNNNLLLGGRGGGHIIRFKTTRQHCFFFETLYEYGGDRQDKFERCSYVKRRREHLEQDFPRRFLLC